MSVCQLLAKLRSQMGAAYSHTVAHFGRFYDTLMRSGQSMYGHVDVRKCCQ